MKKITASVLASLMCLSMAGCGSSDSAASTAEAAGSASASTKAAYLVGIVQLVQHPALDQATKGFQDELKAEFGDNIEFDYQNASGDSPTCTTIANQFVSEGVDLIMANATPALQAAASATETIPVLGTSITEYGVALGIDNFNGTVGGNVSGTSDLAPLDQQADLFDELLPEAKTIGILYCSAEANSVYQANVVQAALEAKGKTVNVYTFADSNDVASVTQQACSECDALYIPTDNTAASCTEAINNVASQAETPIITGEKGIMEGCGIATLSIDYYELGKTTGVMAAKILKGESDITSMPIEYYANPKKLYNPERCSALGINVPSDFTADEGE